MRSKMGDSPLLAFVKSRHLLIAIAMKDDIEVKLKKKVSKTRKKDKQSDVIERLRVIHSRLEGENITEIGNSNINLQLKNSQKKRLEDNRIRK